MTNMKRFLIISSLALLACGCSDILDQTPDNQIDASKMWSSEELADKGMAGLYKPFYATQLANTQLGLSDGLNRQGIEAMGFPTDYFANSYPVKLLSLATKQADDFQVKFEWQFCYTIIHSCNDAIANLGKASDMSDEKYQRYLCEARFLRAWSYKRLNMLYQGVPIYLEPIGNADCTRTQSTAEEVWQIILDDLDFCIANASFPNNTLSTNYGRPSKGAAYALRGMTYMWLKEYAKAADDFKKVSDCGYGLWSGEYVDFFTYENEKDKEMIFPLQYDEASGYCTNTVKWIGARDNYESWTEVKPSADYVDYFENADGSKFVWSEVPGLEDWDKLSDAQREIFFCRDGLESYTAQKAQVIERVGQDIYNKYYLNTGNEARIKQAYENRDPRLKQIVLTPYEPIDCYVANYNGNNTQRGKQLRWPTISRGTDGGDFWLDKRTSAYYCYKKYNDFVKDHIISRARCHTDWPLIRYTDVLLQYAEALAMQNKIDDAISLVNQVRTRAHMPLLVNGGADANGVNGQSDMIERIRYERRIEFAVEGINFFDELRWGTYRDSKFQGKDINGGKSWWGQIVEYNWYYTDYMWPWTAPLSETQMNSSLTKRAGWAY